jgi:hypothetical protein
MLLCYYKARFQYLWLRYKLILGVPDELKAVVIAKLFAVTLEAM